MQALKWAVQSDPSPVPKTMSFQITTAKESTSATSTATPAASQSIPVSSPQYQFDPNRPFVCHVCKKGFARKQILEVHYRVHTGERPFACEKCGFRFTQMGSLYHHQRKVHGKDRKQCLVCSRVFLKPEQFITHQQVTGHRGTMAEPSAPATPPVMATEKSSNKYMWQCEICKIPLLTAAHAHSHMQQHKKCGGPPTPVVNVNKDPQWEVVVAKKKETPRILRAVDEQPITVNKTSTVVIRQTKEIRLRGREWGLELVEGSKDLQGSKVQEPHMSTVSGCLFYGWG